MSIEVRPVGVSCQLQCTYCYEEGMRERQRTHRYNREAVLASIAKLKPNDHFSLFGGECLILPLPEIAELLEIAYTRSGSSGLQTNGALITDAHIDAFIKYRTQVGISLDGPDELNDSRWAGTLDATRKQTARTHWALNRLIERSREHPHLMPSLIVTLHAGNASKERWPRFLEWLHHLDAQGVRHLNLHMMEMDHKADTLYLPCEELADRLIELWEIAPRFKSLRITKFDEILKLLKAQEDVVCHWKPCDPWNTNAVHGIENDGSPSHCSRTNKDGKNWLPAEGDGLSTPQVQFIDFPGAQHFERQMALYVTPQEYGGCKDCEYWLMCHGQCPGEGMNHDWRMRSSYCAAYKKLFAEGARRLRSAGVIPLCDVTNRKEKEQEAFYAWGKNSNVTLGGLFGTASTRHGDQHGDHTDTRGAQHGDTPHGDEHGDHTDQTQR
jgi:uncharacterized protein